MKQQPFAALLCLASCLILPLSAKEDVPRGFAPLAELQQVQAKNDGKKLVVVVVKGSNDQCPHCVTAMETGLDAAGSGTVKLFARAEALNKADTGSLPPALKERVKKGFTTGAWVTFLVFKPDMSAIVAEANREQLDENKEATSAFKKSVQEAKKALK
jgi:hypothetical protein